MRSFIAIAVIAAVAAFSFNPTLAEDAAKQETVRIEADQQAKAFVFIIDDEPVAMLDKKGLHVPGEINYGLWITDTGPEHINKRIASRAKEARDD